LVHFIHEKASEFDLDGNSLPLPGKSTLAARE
jgi:hypothetical protein